MVSISEAEEQQEPDTGSAPATIFNEASASANDDKMNEDNHHPQNEDTMDKSGGQNHDQDSSAIQQETKDTDMVDSSLEENVGKGMDHPMKGEGEPSSAQQENEGAITQETEQKVENGHLEEKQDVTTEDASSPDSGWVFVNGTNPKSSSPREKSILEAPARINGSKTSLAKSLAQNGVSKTTPMALNGHSEPPPIDSDDEILIFRPSAKRRRTTSTRPQPDGVTNRFVVDFILDQKPEMPKISLQELIAGLKEHFATDGVPPKERVRLLEIMGSGRLQGQVLEYKPSEGKGINLSGRITADGKISCDCMECQGSLVSLLEFEEHSGVWKQYQMQCVYLPDQNITLKDLWIALNAEFGIAIAKNGKPQKPPSKTRSCKICHKASKNLMQCGGGCKQFVHAQCAGLKGKENGPWSCLNCVEAQINRMVEKNQAAKMKAAQKAKAKQEAALQKASESKKSGTRAANFETPQNLKSRASQGSKVQSAPRSGMGSKPQRVHMAAPTAKAGLTKGRLVRNSNKHKRLFDPNEPNGVKNGQHVVYKTTQGEVLLEGEIRVSKDGPCGILCEHCNAVISCSAFEAHAGRGSRRAPYDNIFLNGIALRKLAQALPAEEVVYLPSGEQSETAVQEDMMGGCVLCEENNFQRDGFSDLTVILCDGCEREYHVKCLREQKAIALDGLPEGDWFCSAKCQEIHHRLRNRVNLGPIDLDEDYQWQLLHGKDGTTSTTWQLKGCQDILEESFDPIIDQISKQNLVKGMVYSEQQGEWDHSGMFAAVLKYKVGFLTGQRKLAWLAAKQETRMQNILMMRNARRKRIEGHLEQQLAGEKDTLSKKSLSSKGFAIPKKQAVCALVMRSFGDMLAEVPLIATKTTARRKGHARYLMDALGNVLAEMGVKVLSLPAAHATVETWTKGFGFRPMSADSLLETRESLRLLVFPGTEVLYKPLTPEGDPYVAPKKPKQIKPPSAPQSDSPPLAPEPESLPENPESKSPPENTGENPPTPVKPTLHFSPSPAKPAENSSPPAPAIPSTAQQTTSEAPNVENPKNPNVQLKSSSSAEVDLSEIAPVAFRPSPVPIARKTSLQNSPGLQKKKSRLSPLTQAAEPSTEFTNQKDSIQTSDQHRSQISAKKVSSPKANSTPKGIEGSSPAPNNHIQGKEAAPGNSADRGQTPNENPALPEQVILSTESTMPASIKNPLDSTVSENSIVTGA